MHKLYSARSFWCPSPVCCMFISGSKHLLTLIPLLFHIREILRVDSWSEGWLPRLKFFVSFSVSPSKSAFHIFPLHPHLSIHVRKRPVN
jgi:hypothetical protein